MHAGMEDVHESERTEADVKWPFVEFRICLEGSRDGFVHASLGVKDQNAGVRDGHVQISSEGHTSKSGDHRSFDKAHVYDDLRCRDGSEI
nr:hypothetical protein CFP56_37274 [Quercus suber]